MSRHSYVIIMRLASNDQERPIFGMEWRLSDHNGVLPNTSEELHLMVQAREHYYAKHGINAYRSSLVCLPWLPADGVLPDWQKPLGKPRKESN